MPSSEKKAIVESNNYKDQFQNSDFMSSSDASSGNIQFNNCNINNNLKNNSSTMMSIEKNPAIFTLLSEQQKELFLDQRFGNQVLTVNKYLVDVATRLVQDKE